MADFLDKLCGYVWSGGTVFLLLFTGVLYTLRLGFIQLRLFPFIIKNRDNSSSSGGLSQLKTVCMSLGTAMGTGNITGVAAALALGGAGAVFWMWVSAFFGMALVYAENSLSVTYSDSTRRGPMAYLERGLGCRFAAVVFAVMCAAASVGMGGMVQVSSFIDSLEGCIPVNRFIAGTAVFLLIFLVTGGGAKRIGTAAQILLPAASVIYMAICAAVLIRYGERIPTVLGDITGQALGLRQAAGGAVGYSVSKAVSVGIRRGIFSNEAGLGSSPILHSAAESSSPELQGMWSMFEVFFDTVICCTLTALTILCAAPDLSLTSAFGTVLGSGTDLFLAAESAVFAFCTVIGWYYCGETAIHYIFPDLPKKAVCAVFSAAASLGAVLELKVVWTLSDIFNGLMIFPNLLGLLLLVKKVKRNNLPPDVQ